MDVFASAAQKDMDEALKQGLVLPETRTDFAGNKVVLIVPAEAKTSLKSFEGLSSAGIKRIAAGNPKTVPAGRYADVDAGVVYATDAGRQGPSGSLHPLRNQVTNRWFILSPS